MDQDKARLTHSPHGLHVKLLTSITTDLPRSYWSVLVLITRMAIPIVMIVLGVQYKNTCPIVQLLIPIYLNVGGAVGVLRILCNYKKAKGNNNKKISHLAIRSNMDYFLFIWFICGTVFIYQKFPYDFEDYDGSFYCQLVHSLRIILIMTSVNIAILIYTIICCAYIYDVIKE